MGCHFLLQVIFPTQRSNLCLLHWQSDSLTLSHQGLYICNHFAILGLSVRSVTAGREQGCPPETPAFLPHLGLPGQTLRLHAHSNSQSMGRTPPPNTERKVPTRFFLGFWLQKVHDPLSPSSSPGSPATVSDQPQQVAAPSWS